MDIYQSIVALLQVIMIDLILAGDNAVVVGMAASRVHPSLRTKVIAWGVGGAVVLRVLFALVATQLLTIVGLTLAGGILLLWVCWKMYRELTNPEPLPDFSAEAASGESGATGSTTGQTMSFRTALTQIVIADVSMSLDNVLAVAGAAKGELWILVVGLAFAVAFMALLSAYIARLLAKHHWITWIGLLVVLYVAFEMIWAGTRQVGCAFVPASVCEAGTLAIMRALLP